MALEIVKLYISLLSQFFLFSHMFVSTPPMDGPDTTPVNLPKNSNSLTTAYHLMKTLGEIQDAVNDISALDISKEASSSLKGLLDSARWKFVEIFIKAWLRGKFGVHRCMHGCIYRFFRFKYLLLSGDVDRVDAGSLHNRLPLSHARLPKALLYICIQDCRRCRPVRGDELDVVQIVEAEHAFSTIHEEDHQGIFGQSLRVPGRPRSPRI